VWRCLHRFIVTLALLAATTTAGAAPGTQPLRFGAVSFYNPRIMYLKYQPLVDYLSARTGRPWELVISPSYEETVEALCDGRLALAYLGPLTYVRAHARCGALPVVRLNTDGSSTYRSLIMVRRDSPISSLAGLAGKRFGFGSPLSTSSHLVPRAMLMDAGVVPGRDVRCVYYEHHERAARAVLLGEVEACGIRDTVGRKFEQRGLRVLAESVPIPNFPLVLAHDADGWLRQEVVRALVVLPRADPAAREIIAGWDEELASGFALTSDGEFDAVRELGRRVFGPYYLELSEDELSCTGRGG
jgi:phosphonate transport system substrate-binding protein